MAEWPVTKSSWRLFGKLAFHTNHNGHESGGGELDVRHAPQSRERPWHVRVSGGSGDTHVGGVLYGSGDRTLIRDSAEVQPATEVQPPSENLRQLIAQHHLHPDQWPILLDAIQEEYPQLHEAVEAHHADRRSGDSATAQYARAVSATLSATR